MSNITQQIKHLDERAVSAAVVMPTKAADTDVNKILFLNQTLLTAIRKKSDSCLLHACSCMNNKITSDLKHNRQ